MPYAGEFAALGAAFFWSWTAIFFAAAGERVGSVAVNTLRLTMASLFLFVTALAIEPISPLEWYDGGKPLLLLLSGIVGLAIGDGALFKALILFGPRRTSLVLALAPIFAALISWPVLGEALSLTAWCGILLTTGGVIWVVAERSAAEGAALDGRKRILAGLTLGVIASLSQAVGLILAKAGMGDAVPPVAATFLRMIAATSAIWVFVLFTNRGEAIQAALRHKEALGYLAAGSVVGPYLGVWLSLVSVRYAETGVAATLMGMVPIMVIPWVILIRKEWVSLRAIGGTVIAILGTALLFQR